MTWNIEGLLPKLKFPELITYLNQFDIFALSETWVQNCNLVENIFQNFDCYFCAVRKNKSFGRAMAGLVVFVRHSVCKNIKRVCNDCDFAIFLQLDKHALNLNKDVLFCFTYLPPDNSPYYENKQLKGVQMFENQLLEMDIENVHLVILGDLNARTAELSDFVEIENNVPELEEYDEILSNKVDIQALEFRVIKLLTDVEEI